MIDLKTIRQAKDYTQQELADKVGVVRTTIAMIEGGCNKPSIETAKRLGTVLDLDWTLFFSDSMSPKVENPQKRRN